MQAASRAYVLAAAAVAATSAVVLTPAAPKASHIPVRSMETRLVDVTDVPINLFDDVVNIPYNEIQGIDVFGNSLLFSGDWWVPSATNIWGTDPGDLGHYMGLLDMALPFAPQISGLDQPEIDPTADANGTAGLAQQIALLAAAELPTSSSCDAQTCAPLTPAEVITGNTGYDRDIGFFEALAGNAQNSTGQPFDLFSNWLQVPLSDLTNGFTFTPANDPGLIDPSPDLGPDAPGVTGSLGFDGTTGVDGTGAGDYMPWAGDTFKLNLFGPFQDFYNSLFTAPTGGIDGTGIELPTSTECSRRLPEPHRGLDRCLRSVCRGKPGLPGGMRTTSRREPAESVARCGRLGSDQHIAFGVCSRIRREHGKQRNPKRNQRCDSTAANGDVQLQPDRTRTGRHGAGKHQSRIAGAFHQRWDNHRPRVRGIHRDRAPSIRCTAATTPTW